MGIALLSQTAYLRRSSTLSFIPLPPSNLRPFGAPPSIGRRERPREPLPLEGAAERSEAGLASFLGGEAASSLPSPLRKEGCVTALGCSYIACLRRSPTLFHTARTLSGSLRSPPSPRGEGFVRRYSFSTYACIRSDNARKAAFSYRRSLPPWGRLCRGYCFSTHACIRSDDMGIALLSQTTHLRRSSRSFLYRFPHPTSAPSGHRLP